MKKLSIIISILILYVLNIQNANAQGWTPSGTDVITDVNTDKVGIGTTNPPNYKLEVAGDIGLSNNGWLWGGNTTNDVFRILGGPNDGTAGPSIDLNGSNFNTTNNVNGGILFTAIGSNTPVPAQIAYSFWSFDMSSFTLKSILRMYHDGKFQIGVPGAEKFVVDENGKVGIGTTSPWGKFHVVGGSFFEGSIAALQNVYGMRTNWALSISANTSAADGANIDLYGKDDPNNPGRMFFSSYGNNSNLGFGFDNSATGASLMRIYNDGVFALGPVGSERFVVDENGRVGIGTTSPWDKFHVVGNSFFEGNVAALQNIFGMRTNWALSISANTSATDGANIDLYGKDDPNNPGRMFFSSYGNNSNLGFGFDNSATGASLMRIYNDGKMVVGSSANTASDLFTVSDGNIGLKQSNDNNARSIKAYTSNSSLNISANNHAGDGPQISLAGKDNTSHDWYGYSKAGRISLCSYGTTDISTEFITYDNSGGYWTTLGCMKKDGKFVIGSDIINHTPEGYNLYVSKGILTEKVKVTLTDANGGNEWPDFVFDKSHDLMPLNKVVSYIETNKHLPGVPSAAEVVKDGIDLAKMDATLLQKIEELTLYVIQQQKMIEEQQKKIEVLNTLIKK